MICCVCSCCLLIVKDMCLGLGIGFWWSCMMWWFRVKVFVCGNMSCVSYILLIIFSSFKFSWNFFCSYSHCANFTGESGGHFRGFHGDFFVWPCLPIQIVYFFYLYIFCLGKFISTIFYILMWFCVMFVDIFPVISGYYLGCSLHFWIVVLYFLHVVVCSFDCYRLFCDCVVLVVFFFMYVIQI